MLLNDLPMLRTYPALAFFGCFAFSLISAAAAQIDEYSEPTVYGRTGVTSFNMPDGSSISSPTISIDDNGDVALDVNFVGGIGNPGLFYASKRAGDVSGGIVFNASDIIFGEPSTNGQRQAILTVGFDDDLFLYDETTSTTVALNFPLGVTDSTRLTLDAADRIGGRLGFGFDGDAYGVFSVQSSGFPALDVYAADSDLDAASPFSFLYSPDMSRGDASSPPRIAAKVSLVAGFDFEEIRIFDSGGNSTLIAVETKLDPGSPFSEFVTNSVSISDNGNWVAFQANDVDGDSGIYRYDDSTEAIQLVGSVEQDLVNSVDFFAPDVNDDGVVVFRGDDSSGRSSVFAGDGVTLVRVGGEEDMVGTDLGQRQLGRRDQDFSQSGGPKINNRGDIGWIMQYHDPTNPASIADGSLIMVSLAQQCLLGDINQDGALDLLDVGPFIDTLSQPIFPCEADMNEDGSFDLLDVAPFIEALFGN